MFIDCSGDGDIVHGRSNYERGDEVTGALQPGTIRYYFDINFRDNCDLKVIKTLLKSLKKHITMGHFISGYNEARF